MTVIIANGIPPMIRGLLRRWFIEPKPNVFVGSVNMRTREKTIDFLRRNAANFSMLVIYDDDTSQGYSILSYGTPDRQVIKRSGLTLILENPDVLSTQNENENS